MMEANMITKKTLEELKDKRKLIEKALQYADKYELALKILLRIQTFYPKVFLECVTEENMKVLIEEVR